MKKRSSGLLGCAIFSAAVLMSQNLLAAPAQSSERDMVQTVSRILYTQTASGAQLVKDNADLYTLTLTGVSPMTTYFADRPNHKTAGRLTTKRFAEVVWPKAFAGSPPNASIVFEGQNNKMTDTVLELINPRYNAKQYAMVYDVKPVGKFSIIPGSYKHTSVFIDGCVNPWWCW
jgi:hypothetical protein